ncbi:Got1/Sft2-like vescicle transport protein family [Actinidia rufa]|uniref:Vesicle transport protein n=1 Tax=Actinidia rufa TaxID=165716 RepID=A0A7J0DDZ2_9ERIC|nr:Got1/Sft2-like vescicle transport protein family [Actinidia rufa]
MKLRSSPSMSSPKSKVDHLLSEDSSTRTLGSPSILSRPSITPYFPYTAPFSNYKKVAPPSFKSIPKPLFIHSESSSIFALPSLSSPWSDSHVEGVLSGLILASNVCSFACASRPYLAKSLIVFAKPIKFALLFTFANMLAVGRYVNKLIEPSDVISSMLKLGSTSFLIGPAQQIRMMLDPIRIYATAIYVGCVVLALICALWIHSKILTILAIISEICALIWYSLSYIPFARRVVSDMTIRLFDTEI